MQDVLKSAYDIRKYFTERAVNLWNSLPSLVAEAPSLIVLRRD